MAAGDDLHQSQAEEVPAGEATGEVEEIRRSLARGGRPRVGRRFDAVMQKARATQVAPEPQRRAPAEPATHADLLPRRSSADEQAADRFGEWAAPAGRAEPEPPTAGPILPDPPEALIAEEPRSVAAVPIAPESSPAQETPAALARWATATGAPLRAPPTEPPVPIAETTGDRDPVLRADEWLAIHAGPRHRAHGGGARGRVLGIGWPPASGTFFIVAVIALVAFGLGAVAGGSLVARTSAQPTPSTVAAAPVTTQHATQHAATQVRAPQACLDTARLGDQTIDLLTANVRGRQLAEALRRYTIASQKCRQVASQSR